MVLSWTTLAGAAEEDRTIAQMKETSRTVRDLLRKTRKSGTKEAVACVDEALSRVDVATRSAVSQAKEARAADDRGDADGAAQARRRIAELRFVVTLAAKDARACTPPPPPPPKVLLGTVVKVTVDPAIPPVTP